MKRIAVLAALVAVVALGVAFLVRPRPVGAERATHGRVSLVQGSALVKGPGDVDWSYLDRNGTVSDGDVVWADDDSLTEIEMERGAWLRLGPEARVELRRLPPGGEVRLQRGSLYADLTREARAGLLVHTAAGSIRVPPAALARVDLLQGDEMRVLARRGPVVVLPPGGRERTLRAEQALFLSPAGDVRPGRFVPSDLDAFDRWGDQRVSYYAPRPLPLGVNHYLPGIYELGRYGSWVDYDGGRYWRPTRLAAGWRPYHDGYWGSWRDRPLWVAEEPWGYTTSHYGRWRWVEALGWLWRPDRVWGPGWVR